MNGKKAKALRKQVRDTMAKVGRDRGFKFYLRRAKEMYNKGLITALILFIFMPFVYPDIFEIPYTCYPKVIQQHFADYKYKIDLFPNERDADSWGFLENGGTSFKIVTYHGLGDEELRILREITISLMKKLKEIEDGKNSGK